MTIWVFGYGSLIWKAGFNYDERLVGFNKGCRCVFYQVRTIEGRLSIQEEESHWNPQKEKSVGALPTRSRRRKIKKLLER